MSTNPALRNVAALATAVAVGSSSHNHGPIPMGKLNDAIADLALSSQQLSQILDALILLAGPSVQLSAAPESGAFLRTFNVAWGSNFTGAESGIAMPSSAGQAVMVTIHRPISRAITSPSDSTLPSQPSVLLRDGSVSTASFSDLTVSALENAMAAVMEAEMTIKVGPARDSDGNAAAVHSERMRYGEFVTFIARDLVAALMAAHKTLHARVAATALPTGAVDAYNMRRLLSRTDPELYSEVYSSLSVFRDPAGNPMYQAPGATNSRAGNMIGAITRFVSHYPTVGTL